MAKSASDRKVAAAFHEVHENTPGIVKKTTAKKGKAAGERQRVAIALSKAREAGANIPVKDDGGVISKDGMYNLQKGERVVKNENEMRNPPQGKGNVTTSFKRSASYDAYNQNADPNSGARACPGKDSSNEKDALGKPRGGSVVENAKDRPGVALSCVEQQVGQNGNPKKRDASGWGISREMIKTAKKLD